MIRKFTRAFGAFAILGMLSTSIASADQALTVAATTPATTAASTSTVAPAANADSTSSADVAQAGPLSDVPLNSWAYDAVDQLAKDGVIKGYPDGTYKGARPMTRYEAAVLAYRAVDMIEAQITAGKAVDAKLRADIDAANKLITAFGAELKTVERHVDALQQEADATKSGLDTTNRVVAGHSAQIGALTDFNRRAQIHVTDIFRTFAYGQNIQANCGSFNYAANPAGAAANGVQSYCANTGGGNALLHGVKTGGYQPVFGASPPSNNLPNGQRNAGQGFNYFKLTFSGNPSPNVAFLRRTLRLGPYGFGGRHEHADHRLYSFSKLPERQRRSGRDVDELLGRQREAKPRITRANPVSTPASTTSGCRRRRPQASTSVWATFKTTKVRPAAAGWAATTTTAP